MFILLFLCFAVVVGLAGRLSRALSDLACLVLVLVLRSVVE